jgi:hypothetical protein
VRTRDGKARGDGCGRAGLGSTACQWAGDPAENAAAGARRRVGRDCIAPAGASGARDPIAPGGVRHARGMRRRFFEQLSRGARDDGQTQ